MGMVRCPICGTPLQDDAVICSGCGKVISASAHTPRKRPCGAVGRNVPANGRRTSAVMTPEMPQRRAAPRPVKNTNVRTTGEHRKSPPPQVRPRSKTGTDTADGYASPRAKKIILLISRVLCLLLLAAAVYAAGYFIQTARIKTAGYPFSGSMKMTYSTYGKAMENYFEDGSWSVNLFTGKCSYKGSTKHGEVYELYFSAGRKVKLTGLTIDGEKVDEDKLESKIMGMFI